MTKIIATSKERLIQYLDYKGIGLGEFFEGSGLKRGFLDSNKLHSTISDVFLTKIIAFLPDLNLIWLITGLGEWEDSYSTYANAQSKIKSIDLSSDLIGIKDKYLEVLEKNMELHEENKRLRELATKKDTEFPKETYYSVAEDTPKPLAGSKKKLK